MEQNTYYSDDTLTYTFELNAMIQELENQLKQRQLQHTIELKNHNHTIELQKQELQHSNELKDALLKIKDLEIENLKLKTVAK